MDTNKKIDKAAGILGAGIGAAFICGGGVAIFCDEPIVIALFALVGAILGCKIQSTK